MAEPAPAAAPPASPRLLEELREGLARAQKEIPPKYFYDVRGSELFEEITRLPEYYLTRTERALLETSAARWVAELRPLSLVELGAGSAAKTRVLLEALRAAGAPGTYVPVDVSAEFLADTAARLRREYPGLRVEPAVADLADGFPLLPGLPRPLLYAFLGSTIGNFAPQEAARLLRRVRAHLQPGDRFLMGVDLRKDPARIEAAYNDTRGVTAEFNRNALRVLNREAGADFDPSAFEHLAFYHPVEHRVEMHLVSTLPQRVHVPGLGSFGFRAGETLRTEISCKHSRESVSGLLAAAALEPVAWETDSEGLYALVLAAPLP